MSTCYCDGTAHPFRSDYCGRLPAHDDTTAIETARRQRQRGAHEPQRVTGFSDFPDWVFVDCSCGERPIANVWLTEHWTGDPEDGKAAVSAVIRQQAAAKEEQS